MQSLRAELTALQSDDKPKATIVDDEYQELLQAKEELLKERDEQVDALVRLRSDLAEAQERQRAAEKSRLDMLDEAVKLRSAMKERERRDDAEAKKRDRMERTIKDLKATIESKMEEVKGKQASIQGKEEENSRLEMMLRERENQLDRLGRDHNMLTEKCHRVQQDLDDKVHENTQLQALSSQQQVDIRTREDEIAALRADVAKAGKARDAAMAKVRQLERAKAEADKKNEMINREKATVEREMEGISVDLRMAGKKQEDMARERDVLSKQKANAETLASKRLDEAKVVEGAKRSLESEIDGFKMDAQRMAMNLSSLEKSRAQFQREAEDATQKYLQALEEVKTREMAVMDLQKKVLEGEARLKQQQNLYEAVRSDRNLYSKNLIEAQDEIQELKRKMKVTNHQIDQLKELIKVRDWSLTTSLMAGQQLEKQMESRKVELSKVKDALGESEENSRKQELEIIKLSNIVREADQERARMKKEYEVVVNERDILGTQLIRRNDELALLYEKVKIQQSTLLKGQVQYRDRVNEIRVLKVKLSDLKREVGVLRTSVQNITVLKREVHHLSRELLRERARVRALSEELETPMNVHRWRKLEGSDPATFEMIQKIQTLQKRLINKTEEVVEKDLAIKEKERMYLELKNILARQPGPEAAEQLSVYRSSLKEKTRQMKAMASELNMLHAQGNEYKYEIERLVRELNDMKRKYFETRRREQLDRTGRSQGGTGKGGGVQQPPMSMSVPAPDNERARFMGGGFSLAQLPG